MSNINRDLIKEQPMSERLAVKRSAQEGLESDSAMIKTGPDTPGAIKTHPLEEAFPVLETIKSQMEQVRQILAQQYHAIESAQGSGDFSVFLDPSLANNPDAWTKKEGEIKSILNKLLTILPTTK